MWIDSKIWVGMESHKVINISLLPIEYRSRVWKIILKYIPNNVNSQHQVLARKR